jgi:hypothetical protein
MECPMRVRDLAQALAKFDPDLDVVIQADPEAAPDFIRVSVARLDTFLASSDDPQNLMLADDRDEGIQTFVQLCGARC